MRNVVGIVSKITGRVTIKDFENNKESELQLGDVIQINDNVWVRGLDAEVEILLYHSKVTLKAGSRTAFTHEYLSENNSNEFFDMREIGAIVDKIKGSNTPTFGDISQFGFEEEKQDSTPMNVNVWVTSKDNTKIAISAITHTNVVVYQCSFGDILIHINARPYLEASLLSFDERTTYASISTNDQGVGIFALNETNKEITHNLTLVIYQNGQIVHKSKLSLAIKIEEEKKN